MTSNYSPLNDKVCLVTGAGRGIGRAVAAGLAANGAIVYANCRREGAMDELVNEMGDARVIPVCFDVTDTAEAKKAVMRINKEQGRLDVLVNNAGIMRDALIGMVSRKMMEEIFSVNVFAVMELLQLAAKLMIRQRGGSIINISSIVGTNGNRGQLVYSASKAAVIGLTKTAAKELAPHNIRVNAIAPGMIDTDMFRSIGAEHVAARTELIGMGRLGAPEDIAGTCVYLASDMSAYVTGQVIGVDGSALV